MSTEPIADPTRAGASRTPAQGGPEVPAGSGGPADGLGASPAGAPASARCSSCGALLASDQRYCLECGERRVPMSSFLPGPASAAQAPASPPAAPPLPPALPADASRSSTLSVIAFVGVLLLAMGVGVLIGRAGNTKQSAPPAQVVTVDTPGSSGASEASFSGDWPSGTNGYTVQLRTLPTSGTSLSAVEAAKRSASSEGATAVGALKSEEFSTLPSGNYVIYSGVYHTKAAAQKALSPLKKSFPGAAVIHVGEGSGSGGSGSGGSGTGSSGGGGGVGSSPTKPAPPSVLKNLDKNHGKSYEEKSKNLPDVVETG